MSTARAITTGDEHPAIPPRKGWQRLTISGDFDHLTHYLFRYPAKFHPRVVRALLERYTKKGDLILDPFCGSGTLLVEASALDRPSLGIDIDPVAVIVARAKVHRYKMRQLRASATRVLETIKQYRRPPKEYELRMFDDLKERQYTRQVRPARPYVPALPNLFHWFRKYVIVDLARIRQVIERVHIPETHRFLFRVVFASIIRNASNADPVPVSGLEVTSHMKRRDEAGRLVDPFALFEQALCRALDACATFGTKVKAGVPATVVHGDATHVDRYLMREVDAVITSPPYHGAVDYYRRHKLEMFWLGQTKSQQDRLKLLQAYIGRPKVAASHPFVADSSLCTTLAKRWEAKIRAVSEERADAFRHYLVAMTNFFKMLSSHLPAGAPIVLIVGHSTWNEARIPTSDLFAEIAGHNFSLEEVLWYPVKNRYMSYSRHNDASIDREYVLVFQRAQGARTTSSSSSSRRRELHTGRSLRPRA